MHHRPSGPPLSARVQGALTRWSLLVRAAFRRTVPARPGRLALGALVTTTVVGLVLAIPVVSGIGPGTSSVILDASSSSTAPGGSGSGSGSGPGDSPVVMGVDGEPPTSAAFAGVHTSVTVATTPPTTTTGADTGSGSSSSASNRDVVAAPGTTGSAPAHRPATSGATTVPRPPATSPAGSPSSSAGSPGTGTTSPGTSDPVVLPAEPAEAPPPEPDASDPVSEAVALINAERTAAGCAALVADAGLAATAGAHSAAMSATGVLGLDGLDLAGLGGAAAVAAGRPTAQSAVAGWLADPADSATVLDCSRTSIGVGAVDGWWTALFA